ncbi:MAG TPA: thiamine pyrophosphate-dependent enzyme [Aeromicrobium sp.]|nr:thiamine pyrophosphate-dependent enzyme [Aeromicrobium sp.]
MGESAREYDAQSAVPCVQLLTPDGVRLTDETFAYSGDVEAITELFRQMVLIRRIDAEGFALLRHGELALWPPVLGQEAAQVGSAAALGPADFVYGTYRETSVGWLRGVDIADLIAVWRGSSLGGWDARRYGFAPMSIVIGSHPLHATGHALGLRLQGVSDAAVLTYFGDGATSQGDVMEALEFAVLDPVPVVFFCQNNQYAISLPADHQSAMPIVQRAQGFGMPAIRVDGNDVLACQAVTEWALDHARGGAGPVFVEALTYRMGPHTTSDDPTRYRDASELDEWRARDPVDRVRRYLQAAGVSQETFADIDTEAERLGESVRAACLAIPEPDLAAWFDSVYAEQTDELRAQQAEYVAWRSQYGGAA